MLALLPPPLPALLPIAPWCPAAARVGMSPRLADSGVRQSSIGQRILRASRHSATSGEIAVGSPTARSIGRSE